jgi:hypothetical protein
MNNWLHECSMDWLMEKNSKLIVQLLFKKTLIDIFLSKSWTITNDYKWKILKICQMYDKCENKGAKYASLKKKLIT